MQLTSLWCEDCVPQKEQVQEGRTQAAVTDGGPEALNVEARRRDCAAEEPRGP